MAWVQGFSEAISPASAVTGKLLTEGSDKSIVQCSVWCLQTPDCEKYRFKNGHCSLYAAGTDVLNVSESEGRLYSLNDWQNEDNGKVDFSSILHSISPTSVDLPYLWYECNKRFSIPRHVQGKQCDYWPSQTSLQVSSLWLYVLRPTLILYF